MPTPPCPGRRARRATPASPAGRCCRRSGRFATNTSAPPSNGQIRTNAGNTLLWIAELDTDGYNRAVGLGTVTPTSTILVRAANGTAMDLQITGAPVDNGAYWTFPVSVISGTVTKGARTQLNFITPTIPGLPSGGTTGQVLTKTSGADYAATFQALPAATDTTPGITRYVIDAAVTDAHMALNLAVTPAALANHALLSDVPPIVVKATEPTAADYGLATIPVGAIWVES